MPDTADSPAQDDGQITPTIPQATLALIASCSHPPSDGLDSQTVADAAAASVRSGCTAFGPLTAHSGIYHAVREAVTVLERSGMIARPLNDRYVLTDSGRHGASSAGSISQRDIVIMRRCMDAAAIRQPPAMTKMQQYISDMRRGRPPRWR